MPRTTPPSGASDRADTGPKASRSGWPPSSGTAQAHVSQANGWPVALAATTVPVAPPAEDPRGGITPPGQAPGLATVQLGDPHLRVTGGVRAPRHPPAIGRELRGPDRRPLGADPPRRPRGDRPDPDIVVSDEGQAIPSDRRVAEVGPRCHGGHLTSSEGPVLRVRRLPKRRQERQAGAATNDRQGLDGPTPHDDGLDWASPPANRCSTPELQSRHVRPSHMSGPAHDPDPSWLPRELCTWPGAQRIAAAPTTTSENHHVSSASGVAECDLGIRRKIPA